MSSPKLGEAVDGNQETFPPVDVEGSVNPAANNNGLQVDPVSSQMATSKELKEKAEADEKIQKKKDKECAAHTLKSAIIISGVVMAVIGAIFAVTKKLREKN